MRGLSQGVVLAGLALILGSQTAAAEEKARSVIDSALRPHLGKKATVVIFLGTGCPISNAYLPHLNDLAKKYETGGVKLLGVNSNAQDSAEDIARHAKEYSLRFPVLKDDAHRIAAALAAERVPEAFVIDANKTIRYRGRIDDRYTVGGRKNQAGREDLALAIDEVLAGKKVSVARTTVSGCVIGRDEAAARQPITYTKEIARIIQKRCESCHRPEGSAPFVLTSYDRVKAWRKTIKEVVLERRMPPWHADPHYGKFVNDRSLTQNEIDTLVAWIDGGTLRGDNKDLPPPVHYPKGRWTIGEPDVILSMPQEFKVPPSGVLPYQDFIVDPGFKEDRWIERAQVVPGSKAVHHVVIYLQGAGDMKFLCTYVPGDTGLVLPPGLAKKVAAGTKLRFNLHYTTTGKEERDRTMLGLVFAKQPPKHEVRQGWLQKQDIKIPARDPNHREERVFSVREDIRLLSFFPHMHTRGKNWETIIRYPDGRTETALKVPRYDFNWQHTYRYADPLLLPAGTQITCIAYFDNSDKNPANPDPSRTVGWGLQTWDEMLVGLVEYLLEKPASSRGQAIVALGPERLARTSLLKTAGFLALAASGQKDAPIAEVDVDKPAAVSSETFGKKALALVLPARKLSRDLLEKASAEPRPLGQLWLLDLLPLAGDKEIARDKLRLIQFLPGKPGMPLAFLAVSAQPGKQPDLLLYGKDKEPMLRLPLQKASLQQELPLELELATDGEPILYINILGRYQATLRLSARKQ
jgi:peroxiredoxin